MYMYSISRPIRVGMSNFQNKAPIVCMPFDGGVPSSLFSRSTQTSGSPYVHAAGAEVADTGRSSVNTRTARA